MPCAEKTAATAATDGGITPTVNTADVLDGGVDFTGSVAVPGQGLPGLDAARLAIRGLSGMPIPADQTVQ